MQADIVSQGFSLMLYGMGTVLVFLTALVVATTAMSRAIERWFPGRAEDPGGEATPAGDERLVAVIGAAVSRYRASH